MTDAVFIQNSIPVSPNQEMRTSLHLKNATASIRGCLFRGNKAGKGGVIRLEKNSTGSIIECQFIKNRASYVGFDHNEFRRTDSRAHSLCGGAVYVEDSMLSVQRCRFDGGSAEKYGGGIFGMSSDISIVETSASNLTSREGGFVYGIGYLPQNEDWVRIHMDGCSFSDNRAARASVLSCGYGCRFTAVGSNYSRNMAPFYGGVIELYLSSIANITDCSFDKNGEPNYHGRGGVIHVHESDLSVRKCSFIDGSAEIGGGIHGLSSNISIWETSAFGFFVREQGGFIAAEASSVTMSRCSITACGARQGGAIFLSKSVFKISDTQISQCEAEIDGGAIMGNESSRLLCSGCTLTDNEAQYGGALFLVYDNTRYISLQLDNSTLKNNSAEYGGMHDKADRREVHVVLCVGGIHMVAKRQSTLQDCLADVDECKVAAMVNTSLADNKAASAGGAMYIETVAGFRLNCTGGSKEERLEFYSEEQWKSMKRLTSIDDICTSWVNNSAGSYGPIVASSMFDCICNENERC